MSLAMDGDNKAPIPQIGFPFAPGDALFRILIEKSSDGILLVDTEGYVRFANHAAEDIFGRAGQDLLGQPLGFPLIHTETTDIEVVRPGVAILTVEMRVTPIKHDDVTSLLVCLHDVSRRKQREDSLQLAKIKAEAANKAKSAFLANMSHEIRTPLNGILGTIQLLEYEKLNPKTHQLLTVGKASAKRLLHLINDLLDLSRIDAGKVVLRTERFNPKDLLAETIGMFSHEAGRKGVFLTAEVSDGMPETLLGDRLRIAEVLTNLIGNAVKFTAQGEVKVLLDHFKSAIDPTQAWMLCSVSDTGPGIAEEKLFDLFQAYAQGDSSYTRQHEGAGLGLSITRGLTALMGGSICVDSEKDRGTTCYLSLKVGVSETSQESRLVAAAPGRKELQSWKVLLVEGELVNQMVIKRLLEKLGQQVQTACNGKDALELLENQPFDLIFMDVQMPEMSGEQATQKIRASGRSYSTIPIIAMTAHSKVRDKEKFLEAGMDDFIAKPVDFNELKQVIMKTMEAETTCYRTPPDTPVET